MTGVGNGVQVGTYNGITNSGNLAHYGTKTQLSGAGAGMQYASYHLITNSGNGPHYGVQNELMGTVTGIGNHYGVQNILRGSGTGSGKHYGVQNSLSETGTGTHYGTHNLLSGTGSGFKYGTYNSINSSSGGTHYGTYNYVSVDKGWAGYFAGRNYISDRLSIGELDNANAKLNIITNSHSSMSHIELKESAANDGPRIKFANAQETDHYWIVYGRADDTDINSQFNIYYNGTGIGDILRLRGNGKVGIMMLPSTNTLEVNGTASKNSAGDWLANSDKRLKTNIKTIPKQDALSKLLALRGVTYEWNDDKTGMDRPTGLQYGFIAQELMEVFPTKVSMDNLGYYQTAYGDYDPLFIQAIKELNSKIQTLETEKIVKDSKIEALEKRLERIEKRIEKRE